MASFVKKDGIPLRVALRELPTADENSLVGYIERFDISRDDLRMQRRINITVRVNEGQGASLRGLVPLIATGQKVQITRVR